MEQSPDEVIVVDYGCPDNAADWVEANYPSVKTLRVIDDEGLCVSRARNLGAAQASSPLLCFLDADIKTIGGWLEWVKENAQQDSFYRTAVNHEDGKRKRGSWGSFFCWRRHFDTVEGYDEVFRSWGGEDDDLYSRLLYVGVKAAEYPVHYIDPIAHDDALRSEFYEIKERAVFERVGHCYLQAKCQLILMRQAQKIFNLPIEERQRLMKEVTGKVIEWSKDTSKPMPYIQFTVGEVLSNMDSFRVVKKQMITLTLEALPSP